MSSRPITAAHKLAGDWGETSPPAPWLRSMFGSGSGFIKNARDPLSPLSTGSAGSCLQLREAELTLAQLQLLKWVSILHAEQDPRTKLQPCPLPMHFPTAPLNMGTVSRQEGSPDSARLFQVPTRHWGTNNALMEERGFLEVKG